MKSTEARLGLLRQGLGSRSGLDENLASCHTTCSHKRTKLAQDFARKLRCKARVSKVLVESRAEAKERASQHRLVLTGTVSRLGIEVMLDGSTAST